MKIVIVTHFFNSRSARARALADVLAHRGHEVITVTSEQPPCPEQLSYEVVAVRYTRAITRFRRVLGISADVNLGEASAARGEFVGGGMSSLARLYESAFAHPDRYGAWVRAVKRWVRSTEGAATVSGAACVLATTPPTSLEAGEAIARAADVPFVPDFQDLWSDNPYYPFGPIRHLVDAGSERRLIAGSAAAIAINASSADVLRGRYPELTIEPIPIGIDPSPWRLDERPADGRLVFGHFGATYGNKRDAEPLLKSIARLGSGGLIDPQACRVHMFGETDRSVHAAARELGLEEVLVPHAYIPNSQVPGALADVDIALVILWPEDHINLPHKILHYLAAQKRILVMGANVSSATAQFCRGLAGVTVVSSDKELDDYVVNAWRSAKNGDRFAVSEGERPFLLTADNMADQFLSLLQNLGITDPRR